jgi:hypothetical protein
MDGPPALTKKLSLPEDAFIVSSQHGSISHCTIWVVAMDFSDLSFRSLRLAGKLAKMRKNTLMDHFICLNVVPKGESTERAPAFATCVEELRKCGASPFHIHSKTLELKEGWTISSTLVYYANHGPLPLAPLSPRCTHTGGIRSRAVCVHDVFSASDLFDRLRVPCARRGGDDQRAARRGPRRQGQEQR